MSQKEKESKEEPIVHPVYGLMTDRELILSISGDLRKELNDNPDSTFQFGDNAPMKNVEIINEVNNLTPFGKEIIGNWFSGTKRNLDFLHKEKIKVAKEK